MKTERLLQVTSALCVALGTILLGMGQRDLRMAVLAIIGSALSVWLTDILGLFRLNRWVASGIAFIASLVAFKGALPLNSLRSIIAIAELLVYLELILLFQKKNLRVYWQLLVLSLLQVVVSALFSQGAQFGLIIVIFMFVALLDLALLNLHFESLQASGLLLKSGKTGPPKESFDSTKPRVRILIRKDLFRQVFRMGISTLFLTMLVFFMMPRLGRPAWRSNLLTGAQSVGFTDHIELGELGTAVNDPTEVLRVKLIDPKNPTREPIKSEIYLHGTTLTRYNDRNWYQVQESPRDAMQQLLYSRGRYHHFNDRGSFRNNRGSFHNNRGPFGGYRRFERRGWFSFFRDFDLYREERFQQSEDFLKPKDDELPPGTLLQEIVIEPMSHRELFGVRPYFVTKLSSQIRYDSNGERLLRDAALCRKRFSYHLYTTGIVHQTQRNYYPAEEKIDRNTLLECPDNIPTVIETAKRWINESSLSYDNPFSRAMYINKRLSDPEVFSYNLHSRRSDFSIDPIEDFIKNNPEGHCEYFATTLAMMLRSQGIPCRLAVGFKCDEYNSLGKFYHVRQLHAHSWVEAHFRPEDLGITDPTEEQLKNGLWYRFDPTPIASGDTSQAQKLLLPFARWLNWFDAAWDNYVMEMDRARQNTAVYKPIITWLKNAYQKITDPQWWVGVWQKTKPMLNPHNWNTDKWISWRGGLVGVAVMLTMLVVFRTTRWIYRIFARRLGKIRAEKERRRRIEVEFYRRFLNVAAKLGLTRSQGETPREFAHLAGPQIAETTENTDLKHLPSLITEAYYQVRFGRSPLDKTQQEEIELAVSQLEAIVQKS